MKDRARKNRDAAGGREDRVARIRAEVADPVIGDGILDVLDQFAPTEPARGQNVDGAIGFADPVQAAPTGDALGMRTNAVVSSYLFRKRLNGLVLLVFGQLKVVSDFSFISRKIRQR